MNLSRVLPVLGQYGVDPALVLVPPEGGLLEVYRDVGFPTSTFHLYSKRFPSFWRYYQSLYELVSPIVSSHADLVHINHHYGLEYTTRAVRLSNRPYIVHVRGIESPQWVQDNAVYLANAARLVAVSRAVKERLMTSDLLAKQANTSLQGDVSQFVEVVHDGVPIPTLERMDARQRVRRELGIEENTLLVGLIARLEPLKGVADLLTAVADLRQVLACFKLVIVGTGQSSYVAELESLTHRLSMENSVVFTGFRSDVPAVLAALDLLVVATHDPLTGQGEAFPNIVLESMQAQTPIVARRAGGLGEILDEESGILVPPNGVEPLRNGIMTALMMSADKRQAMVQTAYQIVNTRFTLQNQAQQLASIYHQLISRNRI
ncbi:MAG: glycosyltransferase family 4 protein [Nitrosomonas ureae]